jgi:hypothetical protein
VHHRGWHVAGSAGQLMVILFLFVCKLCCHMLMMY